MDHAGEFGADRIYAGQMFVLGKTDVGDLIQEMWDQEKEHKVNNDYDASLNQNIIVHHSGLLHSCHFYIRLNLKNFFQNIEYVRPP